MNGIKAANAGLSFFLELGALVAVGYWGFTLNQGLVVRVLAGVGVPVLMAVAWGLLASPKATYPLHGLVRGAFDVVWFGAGAAGLVAAGAVTWGTVFAALYVVNAVLRLTLR